MSRRTPTRLAVFTAGVLGFTALLASAPEARADVKIEERLSTLSSNVTRWTFVKGEKRSMVTRAETTDILYNAGGKYGAYVEIARPDRELIYEVDPQERSYREITETQFKRLLQKGIQIPRNANDQPLRTLYNSQTTAIEIVPTGKSRRIAGYEAEQFMARAVIGAQNLLNGKDLRFTFDQEIWLTRDETLLREMRAAEDAYVEVFGTAATLAQAQVMGGEWNDAFITHVRAMNDRIRALNGVVLSFNTTVTEEAIAQSKEEKSTSRKLNVASGEVKKISLDTLPESEFEVPVGYINTDTKVAKAADPGTMIAAAPTVTEMPKPEAPPVTPVTPNPVVARNNPPIMPATAPASPVVAAVPSKEGAAPGTVIGSTGAGAAGTGVVMPRATAPTTVAVQMPPTNVIVPTGNPKPEKTTKPGTGKTEPVVVTNTPPAVPSNYPTLGVITTSAPPPPVVIDEIDASPKKKKKR